MVDDLDVRVVFLRRIFIGNISIIEIAEMHPFVDDSLKLVCTLHVGRDLCAAGRFGCADELVPNI